MLLRKQQKGNGLLQSRSSVSLLASPPLWVIMWISEKERCVSPVFFGGKGRWKSLVKRVKKKMGQNQSPSELHSKILSYEKACQLEYQCTYVPALFQYLYLHGVSNWCKTLSIWSFLETGLPYILSSAAPSQLKDLKNEIITYPLFRAKCK